MGRKLGICPFFGGGELGPHLTQCRLGRGLPPYQVASGSMQLFGRNRYGPKIVPLWGEGELGPHLTQCGQGRGLPACQVSSWSVQPFGHSTPSQTDRTGQTGQRFDSRERTVLQMVTRNIITAQFGKMQPVGCCRVFVL